MYLVKHLPRVTWVNPKTGGPIYALVHCRESEQRNALFWPDIGTEGEYSHRWWSDDELEFVGLLTEG